MDPRDQLSPVREHPATRDPEGLWELLPICSNDVDVVDGAVVLC
jgi:hypothetical protein